METDIKKTILKEAKECIENGDINKAEALLKGYLDFNNDPEISSTLANIYTQRGKLKEALEILKGQDSNYFCVFKSLSEIYIKLEKYDKLYNLWKKSKNRNFQDLKKEKDLKKASQYLKRVQVFLKLFVSKRIEIPKELDYKEQQYVKYDYNRALEHIELRHTSPNNNPNENTSSIFYSHYDLEELFLVATRNIEFEKREIKLKWDFSDTYIFYFKDIGRSETGLSLNFFRVATIPNTNKIITMFPTFNRKSSSLCYLSKQDMLPICNSIVHTDRVYREKTYSINKK